MTGNQLSIAMRQSAEGDVVSFPVPGDGGGGGDGSSGSERYFQKNDQVSSGGSITKAK